jgi:cell division protein FtsB
MMQLVLAAVLLAGTFAAYHYYTLQAAQPSPADPANDLRNNDLQNQVHDLSAQVAQLRQEQSMPAVVLNRYRKLHRLHLRRLPRRLRQPPA